MTSLHKIESVCTSCAEGCGFYTQVERGKVTSLDYLKEHPVNGGGLCLKGNGVLESIYHPGRLHSPLARKEDGTFEAISWDQATDTIASRFKQLSKKHGPDALGFLTSAHCTNEEYYLFQKWARLAGTNNLDCPCFHQGTGASRDLAVSLGSGAVTNSFSDLVNARCILITGSNFLDNHPVVSRWIFEAKAAGATVICADHRRPPSLSFCDHFLQIQPGTAALLIDGMMMHIIEKKLYHQQFIDDRTSGFEAFQKALGKQSLKLSEKLSGIPVAQIREVAERYATAPAAALIQALDFSTPYGNHAATACNASNLALLCGHVGRPGTGVFPLAQQSNAQGCYDMGISPQALPGQVPVKDRTQHPAIVKLWKTKALPEKEGLSLPAMIRATKNRRIRALYLLESNPLEHWAHADQLRKVIKGKDFLVVHDSFLTETAKQADIILPALTWPEKTGTYTSGERRVQWQSKIVNPQNNIIPGWQVICTIAKKQGFTNQFSYSSPEAVLKEINRLHPDYAGLSPAKLRKTGGVTHPCPTPKHPGTPILYTEQFTTPDGRGKFIPVVYDKKGEKPTQKYPFHLTFGKTAASPSSSATGDTSLLLAMNVKDAKKIPVQQGGEVKIATRLGSVKAVVTITDSLPAGVVDIPFRSTGTLALPRSTVDPRATLPELNTAVCQIKKSGGK